MMNSLFFILLFIILVKPVASAPLPKNWRAQISTSYESLRYDEIFEFQSVKNVDYQSTFLNATFKYSYYIFAPYFYVEGELKTMFNELSTNIPQSQVINYQHSYRLGLFYPGDYFWFKLISENKFDTFYAVGNSFGYKNNESWVIIPIVGLNSHPFDGALTFAPYYKYSLMRSGNFKESVVGLEVAIPISDQSAYPLYAYENALVLNFEYIKTEITYVFFERRLFITKESAVVSLGVNF